MSIKVNVVTDFFGDGLKRAQREFQQLEGAGAKAGFVLKKAMVPAIASLGALAAASKVAVEASSDLAESQSKVGVIFGEGAAEVEAFSRTAAKALGQSRRAVLQSAGTFGTFGKAAGLGGKQLATFSNDFTKLASDLASFNNTTPEEAVVAIGAALRGEAEPIRRYGILLNDATMRQKALELGLIRTTKEALTPQNKILAAQALIFEQSRDAQGDFARTSDGLANSQRILTAQMDDLKVSIGQGLLPVVEAVLPLVKSFADWAANNPTTFKVIAAAIGAIAVSILAINAAMALNPITAAVAGIIALGAAVVLAYQRFEGFRNIVNAVFEGLKWYVGMAKDQFLSLVAIFKTVFNALGSAWNNTIGKLSIKIPNIPGLPGRGTEFSFPKIPALAEGGVVTQPTLALIGEAGPEAVVPLDRMNGMGGGTNVTINVQGADPQAVVNALRTYMRQNGSVPIRVSNIF